jgi:DNA-binding IclR family transcriptional regulator
MGRSTERFVDILNCFTHARANASLSEIAVMTKLDKSTVHRLLHDFEHHHLVRRDPVSKRYTLGSRLIEWGALAADSLSLGQEAEAALRQLRDATGETICLTVRDGDRRVCSVVFPSSKQVRRVIPVGQSLRLTQGAGGPLTLAFLPPVEAEAIINTDDELPEERKRWVRKQLPQLRERGFGLSIHLRMDKGWSLATPIFDHTGMPVATILLAAPQARLSDEIVERYTALMLVAAKHISMRLGAPSWPIGSYIAAAD